MEQLDKRKLRYRVMTAGDIEQIIAIEQEAFTEPWTAEAFLNELANNLFAKYIIAEYAGEIIGYGGMWIIIDEAHITNIAIRSGFRGMGFGHLLLTEMKKTASCFGALKMTLEVRVSNNAAQRLYAKHGFEASGIRPNYYSDNGEDAIIMWAELDQKQMKLGEKKQ